MYKTINKTRLKWSFITILRRITLKCSLFSYFDTRKIMYSFGFRDCEPNYL